MNENITPLPWRYEDCGRLCLDYRIRSQRGEAVCRVSQKGGFAEERANAEYIVEACNAHPTLTARVKELEEALRFSLTTIEEVMDALPDTMRERCLDATESVEAALNKEPTT